MQGNKEKAYDAMWAYREALDEQEKVIADYYLDTAQPSEEDTKLVNADGMRRIKAANARVRRTLGDWMDALETWLQLHV